MERGLLPTPQLHQGHLLGGVPGFCLSVSELVPQSRLCRNWWTKDQPQGKSPMVSSKHRPWRWTAHNETQSQAQSPQAGSQPATASPATEQGLKHRCAVRGAKGGGASVKALPFPAKGNFLFHRFASLVSQTVKNLSAMQETRVRALVRKILWRRGWQSTTLFLPGKSHGQRSLAGYYNPQGRKKSDT